MKRTILLPLWLLVALNGFSYISITVTDGIRGETGYLRVTENFKTDGPGNCIFELICSDPGKMTCEFTVLKPEHTSGCTAVIITSGGTGNALNDVKAIVDAKLMTGLKSDTIVPSNVRVAVNGGSEQGVVTFTSSVSSSGTRETQINVYGYTEAQSLGII